MLLSAKILEVQILPFYLDWFYTHGLPLYRKHGNNAHDQLSPLFWNNNWIYGGINNTSMF